MKTPEEIKRGLEFCAPRWMGDHWKNCDSECPYQGEDHFCKNVLNRDTKEYIKQLESQIPRWISVEERLPDSQRDVLTVNGHGYIRMMGLFRKRGELWTWLHEGRFKNYNDITHWMPLPQPPKEDDHA